MWKTCAASIVLLAQITIATAHAQLLDQLKGAMGSGQGGGALAVPSVNQASPSNIAGVLQYCVQNNYVSGGSATSVKDALVGKVTGSDQGTRTANFSRAAMVFWTRGTAATLVGWGHQLDFGHFRVGRRWLS